MKEIEDIACTLGQACQISSSIGFPCLVIPWGLGNVPDNFPEGEFICYEEAGVELIWEKYMRSQYITSKFLKVHVLKAHGWPETPNPK
jgi:hypothetical protein